MHLRPSQNDFDHQLGGYGSGQAYSNYHNNMYAQQGYGYANQNSYSQLHHQVGYGSNQASQSVEIFSPKSFLSQNVSPKSPLLQSQQTLMNGGKMQNGNGLIVNPGSSIGQQQLNQQINYSNSASNLSTKRDYLSPTNRLQQQSTASSLQQQQQIQQQPLHAQQNQLLQQQQYQQNQPLKNNFFQQSSNQIDNQNLYQGGYSVLNQQSSLQNQMIQQSATNGFGKKPQAPALQQQQQQQQQQFSQNNQQHYQLQQQQLKQSQLGMNAKVSPSASNAIQNNTFSQQSSSQVQSGVVVSDMRHLSADALKDKENLQNPLQKIYYDQPSTNKAQSTQKSSILGNQAMRPSSREGYTNSTQSSTLNSNRQQIRASTNSNQLDNRLQRNSYSQQNLKTSNLNSTQLGQNINNSQMKENLLMNGNYAFSMANQSQPQIYEQPGQMGYQAQKNSHMYQSGIVQTNSQLSNHNMKRSEIIEMKHSNYLNSPKYVPVNGNQQYVQQQLDTKESIDKKENYTLFPSNQNTKDKPLTADTRSMRQKSQYKDNSSQGNNNSSLQIENNPTSNSMTSQRKELQRVSSATTTTYAAAQNQKKSQNFKYKTAKTSKISLQRDSQTPKSGEDKKINFSSDTKQMNDISQKEVSYGINTSSSSTTLRNNFVGTSQSQYIQPRQSAILERKTGNEKSASLFNETKGKQAQSTILTSAEQPNVSTVSKSKSPNNMDGKKVGESRVYSDEYQEYKKLQEKLNYLESKIMSIKTNIDSTYQKEKEEQRKESITGQQIADQNNILSATRALNNLNQTQSNKNSASTANLTTLPSSSLQAGPSSTPQGYLSPSTQSKINQDSYSRSSLCSPDQASSNSTANKYSRDEELLYPSGNQFKATTNSFSLEQNSTKASASKQGVSSSTINLYLKNGMNNQTQSTSSLNQVGNTSLNYTSNSTQNVTAASQSEQNINQASNKNANNPLSSFVTQVNRGSGIPLSPKTATNTAKRTKIEEKISSTIQYDPSQINTSLQPSIPKSYLNKSQQQQQLTQQNQSKIQDGSVVSSSVNNSSSKSNNASYKKRDDSDSIDGSQQGTGYYPSSTKNQTSQGKNSLILTKNSAETQSAQSLKNSNILASPTSTSAYKKNIQTTPPYIYYISPIIKAYIEPQNLSPFASLAREHLIQTMQAISFSRMLKPASQKVIDEKKVHLPIRRDNKKTLVFDLDETLIHCNENANIPSDVILPIRFPTGEVIEAGINVRPYCMEILQELSKFYEIIVFTASHSCYANVVLDYLDPNKQYITGRLFRENCVTTEEGVYIKDLRVIANRNLSDIVLVDNAAYSFGFQIDNGIPIIPFYDNKSDAELKHLIHFMKSIHNVRDLREIVRKFLKIGSFSEFSDPHNLIQNLFDDLIY